LSAAHSSGSQKLKQWVVAMPKTHSVTGDCEGAVTDVFNGCHMRSVLPKTQQSAEAEAKRCADQRPGQLQSSRLADSLEDLEDQVASCYLGLLLYG
jgi:hypothetical protein